MIGQARAKICLTSFQCSILYVAINLENKVDCHKGSKSGFSYLFTIDELASYSRSLQATKFFSSRLKPISKIYTLIS